MWNISNHFKFIKSSALNRFFKLRITLNMRWEEFSTVNTNSDIVKIHSNTFNHTILSTQAETCMSQRESSKRTQLTSHLQFHFILLREDSQKISLITPIITKFLNRIPIATSARLPSTHFEKKTSNEIVPHLFYNPIIKGKRVIAGRREETKNHYLFSKTLIFSIILLYPVFLGYIIIFFK